MPKYRLNADQHMQIPATSPVLFEVYNVGAGKSPVRISIRGEGVDVTATGTNKAMLHSAPHGAQVEAKPAEDQTFGSEQQLQLLVTQGRPGHPNSLQVEFPKQVVDGLQVQQLATIENVGGNYDVSAIGASVAVTMAKEELLILRALRKQSEQLPSVSSIGIKVDCSASMLVPAAEHDIKYAATIVSAIAWALEVRDVRLSAGAEERIIGELGGLEGAITQLVSEGKGRIGSHGLVPEADLGIIISDSLPSDAPATAQPLVYVLVGPPTDSATYLARMRQELEGADGRTGPVAVVCIDDRLEAAIDGGDDAPFGEISAAIARAVSNTDRQF